MGDVRVRVHSGDGQELLGEGWYVGDVTVYFIQLPDGSLTSNENAEVPPSAFEMPPGSRIVKSENNPKIKLDNGQVVYGCQVWWEPVGNEDTSVGERWR